MINMATMVKSLRENIQGFNFQPFKITENLNLFQTILFVVLKSKALEVQSFYHYTSLVTNAIL